MDKYKSERRWVSWNLVQKDGRMTKVPVQLNGSLASSTDNSSWCTFAELGDRPKGIVCTPDKKLIFIDIDHCINNNHEIEHEQKEQIENLIREANTYTELSPSKLGLHLFLSIIDDEGFTTNGNRKAPYEIYSSGRYATFTGNTYGEQKEVREVTIEEANRILSTIGYPFSKPKEDQVTILPAQFTNLDDAELLKKMFASKTGKQIEALYNGDTSKFNNDESIVDMSLLSHLAFWTGRNASQMERIWISSPLGSRAKTQNRKDYRDRSIGNAMAKCHQTYEPQKKTISSPEGNEIEFLTVIKPTKDGPVELIISNTENIARVLRNDPNYSGKFRYDIFRNTIEINYKNKNGWRLQEMNDAVTIQAQISIDYPAFAKVGKDMVSDALMLVSKENSFDSAKEYMESLVWDKVPRLDYWLQHTYGAEDNKYHKSVGSNWIKGLVKRIIEPGCKFDYVLVLEGEQGSMKSSSLAVLGGKWHVETSMSTDNKDFFMQFQGKAIIEFSEGETLNKTEVKKMKAIITTQYDKYRPPYERLSQDFPRRCVFAMTTNETEYLKDETGNRRWLPVKLISPKADIGWLALNRDQLFAEAYHRLVIGNESVHEFPEEETKDEQAKRRILNPNTDAIVEWYMNDLTDGQREEGVTVMMAYEKIFNKGGGGNIDRKDEMIISSIFKEILKLDKKRITKNGLTTNRYFYTGKLLVEPKDSLDITKW